MKALFYFLIAVASMSLTACSFSMSSTDNNSSFSKRIVNKETVGKDQVVMFTQGDIQPVWGCKRVGKQMPNAVKKKLKLTFGFVDDYKKQIDEAKDYITENKLTKVNLVQLYIPNEKEVMGMDLTDKKQTSNTFFVCKHPPAENHNPF